MIFEVLEFRANVDAILPEITATDCFGGKHGIAFPVFSSSL